MPTNKFAEAYLSLATDRAKLASGLKLARGQITSEIQSIGAVAAGILSAELAKGALTGLKSLASGFIGLNDRLEQYRLSLGVMLKDQAKANQLISDIEKFASRTPFSIDSLTSAVQQLKNFGFETQQILPMLQNIGDAAAAAPQGMEMAVGRISLALGQMKAKAKVSAGEMLQLSEAGIAAWDMLAGRLGMTVAEAMQQAERGAISADTAIAAILDGMNERFGGMMAKQATTWSGLMSTLEDTGRALIREIGQPVFELAKVELKNLVEWAESPAAKALAQQVVPAVRDIARRLIDASRNAAAFVADNRELIGSLTLMAARAAAVGASLMALTKAAAAINGIKMAFGAMAGPAGIAAAGIGLLTAAFIESQARGEDFATTLDRMTGSMFGLANAADELKRRMNWIEDLNFNIDLLSEELRNLNRIRRDVIDEADPAVKKAREEKAAEDRRSSLSAALDAAMRDSKQQAQQAFEGVIANLEEIVAANKTFLDNAKARGNMDEIFEAQHAYSQAADLLAAAMKHREQAERDLLNILAMRYRNEVKAAETAKRIVDQSMVALDPFSGVGGTPASDEQERQRMIGQAFGGMLDEFRDGLAGVTDGALDLAKQAADGLNELEKAALERIFEDFNIGADVQAGARASAEQKARIDAAVAAAARHGFDPDVIRQAIEGAERDNRRVDRFGLVDFVDSLQRSIGVKDDHQKRAARALEQIRDEGVKIKNLPGPQPARVAAG